MEKRVISTQVQEEDLKIEKSLRPQTLDDYIGQQKACLLYTSSYLTAQLCGGGLMLGAFFMATDSDSVIRRFESCYPSQLFR